MRDTFSNSLVALAKKDSKVLLLTGDHGYALFDSFRKECPKQYINAGIAEQNMVGMAAGLAKAGFRPFVYGLSAFIPVRVVEQIKLDIAHDNLPVVLCGDGAGFVYSHLGTSHQSTEDIATLRAVPSISIYSPADRFELEASMNAAYASRSPVYLRMGKSDRGDIHTDKVEISDGQLVPLRIIENSLFTIIATGSLASTAIQYADGAKEKFSVYSAPTIKPINIKQVSDIARKSRLIITMEEHSVLGGLGGCIAEITSEFSPIKILRIGVQDRFSNLCGTYDYLLAEHGLDLENIGKKISSFLSSENLTE